MIVSAIVATDENGVIGKDNQLPWHLPADLAHFKRTTTGHPIIMGRRTYESIGKPLPGRTNIVMTSDEHYGADGCTVVTSLDQALAAAAKAPGGEEAFIIGGEAIFDLALPRIDRIYLTLIHSRVDGDRFFRYKPEQWRVVSQAPHPADNDNGHPYDFFTLERA